MYTFTTHFTTLMVLNRSFSGARHKNTFRIFHVFVFVEFYIETIRQHTSVNVRARASCLRVLMVSSWGGSVTLRDLTAGGMNVFIEYQNFIIASISRERQNLFC